mgnify:CR=1 FL=1
MSLKLLKPRYGTFSGGIDLPDEKDATLESPIIPIEHLSHLYVPLAPVHATPAKPIVSVGQRVHQGEKIAQASGDGQVDIFAPLAGRVSKFCQVILPVNTPASLCQNRDEYIIGWRVSPAIELVDLDDFEPFPSTSSIYDWLAADDISLCERIAEGGLITFNQRTVALADYISAARNAGVDTLIANVMENTPYITSDHRILTERGLEVIGGLSIIARAMKVSNVILAVDHRRTDSYRQAIAPSRLHGIRTIALANKYPIGSTAIIIRVLTRRRVRAEGEGLEVGVAVVDAATCLATYRWVVFGEVPAARVVTVSGPAVKNPANLLIPFGAEVGEVFASAGAEPDCLTIHGSVMTGNEIIKCTTPTGESIPAVVSASTNALLAMDQQSASDDATPTPCIRCGWCSDSCPFRLNVAALNDDFELGRINSAKRRGCMYCIDCGICSYICPARLPLARRIKLLKLAVVEETARR